MLLRTSVDLGSAIRDRRRTLHLDQNELARQVGVSRKWIIDAEKGKPRAEIGLLLRTLDVLGLRLSLEVGEPPASKGTVPAVDIDAVLDRARGQP
jgi:HTH-type transcriptional regulator/antitoxin HipB